MKYLIFVFSILLSLSAHAQSGQGVQCIKLEGIQLPGCVPSSREICHSGQPANCSVRGDIQRCEFVKGPTSYYLKPIEQESAPSNLECADFGPRECTGTGDSQICTPGQCVRYKIPYCKVACVNCVNNVHLEELPIPGCDRGCSGHYCQGERNCNYTVNCPPNDYLCNISECPSVPANAEFRAQGYILPSQKYPRCQASYVCPDSVAVPSDATPENCPGCQFFTDSRGVRVRMERSGPTTCQENLPITPATPSGGAICPWIRFGGHPDYSSPASGSKGYRWNTDNNSCRPVEVGNRYPIDCCECNGNKQNIDGSGMKCQSCPNIVGNPGACDVRPPRMWD